jgi:hypothetical protein
MTERTRVLIPCTECGEELHEYLVTNWMPVSVEPVGPHVGGVRQRIADAACRAFEIALGSDNWALADEIATRALAANDHRDGGEG